MVSQDLYDSGLGEGYYIQELVVSVPEEDAERPGLSVKFHYPASEDGGEPCVVDVTESVLARLDENGDR